MDDARVDAGASVVSSILGVNAVVEEGPSSNAASWVTVLVWPKGSAWSMSGEQPRKPVAVERVGTRLK